MTKETKIGIGIAATIIVLVCLYLFVGPVYTVWASSKEGQAQLAKAQFNRQVQVAEGLAKEEASKYLAEAEIIRAHGVDSAVRIIGEGLQKNPEYLRYLFIQELEKTSNQVIYLPTEAGLPILEANRIQKPVQTP